MDSQVLIEELVQNYGYISIFIIVMLEYANVPIPSEIVLPLVGLLSFKFELNIRTTLISSTLGGIIGSIVNYYLGFIYGDKFINFIKIKYPSLNKSIDTSYEWINKYKAVALLLARLLPLARTIISIVAGASKVKVVDFILYSTLGIFMWNSILILSSYYLIGNMNIVNKLMKGYSILITTIFIIIALFYIIKRKKNQNKQDKVK